LQLYYNYYLISIEGVIFEAPFQTLLVAVCLFPNLTTRHAEFSALFCKS